MFGAKENIVFTTATYVPTSNPSYSKIFLFDNNLDMYVIDHYSGV